MKQRNQKLSRFLMGKGLYAALAVCLAAAGTAAWITVNSRLSSPADPMEGPGEAQQIPSPIQENIDPLTPSLEEPAPSQPVPVEEPASPVEQKQPDVSKEDDSSAEAASPSLDSSSWSEEEESSSGASEVSSSWDEVLTLSFAPPLTAPVLAPYSGDRLVKNETLGEWRTHNGVDWQAEAGEAVLSACDGSVSAIRFDPLWGTTVEISAQDYVLSYCGLGSQLTVQLGDSVAQGETLGAVDSVPCEAASGSHLHFSVQQKGHYLDPLSLWDNAENTQD